MFKPGDWRCEECGTHNFASRDRCKKIDCRKWKTHKEKRDGEWKCDRCHHVNSIRDFECHGIHCTQWRPKKVQKRDDDFQKRDGDWECDHCNTSNFASRSKCFKCSKQRVKTHGNDWICPKCKDYQFGKNRQCNKCNEMRPSKKTCIVCCDDTEKGVECTSFHFSCDDCLNGDIDANGFDRIDKNANVKCMYPDCNSMYDSAIIVFHVNPQKIFNIAQKHNEKELVEEMSIKQKSEQGKIITNAHYDYITNKILSLACPRCSMVYSDFDGCCALKCKSCSCAFCAWCLEDCGNDAHSHVAKCKVKPIGSDAFFGSRGSVEKSNKELIKRKLEQYWLCVDDKSKKELKERLKGLIN